MNHVTALGTTFGASDAPREEPRALGPLEHLLAPTSLGDFARVSWGKRSALIRGDSAKLSRLLPSGFSLETLKATIRSAGRRSRVSANALNEQGDVVNFAVEGDVAHALLASGHTLFLTNADELIPELGALGQAIQRQLGYPATIKPQVFFGSQRSSLKLHFDTFSVLSIQCEGKKRWRYEEEPLIACPRSTASDPAWRANFGQEHPWSIVTPPDESAMKDVVLEPGDVLYVPAGAWHTTESYEGEALSISLVIEPMGFDQLLARVLRRTLNEFPWRQNFPISDVVSGAAATPPAQLQAFVRARLDEAAHAIASTTPEEFLSILFERPNEPLAVPRPVDPSDCLMLNPKAGGVVATKVQNGKTIVCLQYGEVALELPLLCLPFLEVLLKQRRFVAHDAVAWFDAEAGVAWEGLAPLLELLVTHGVLLDAA